MDIFFALLLKIAPLYLIIFLGFFAGRYLKTQKETIARLLIFIIAPAVIFNSVLTMKLSLSVLSLPVLFFSLSCLICLTTFSATKRIWSDPTRNILAFASGDGNFGYFGLPVAITLFGPDVAGLVIMPILGVTLYENSLGFFIAARGNYSVNESLKRAIKLPVIYAFLIGIILNLTGVKFGQSYMDFADLFRGAFSVLGMMLIGMGLASIAGYKFDFKFIGSTLLTKFVVWPLLILLIILADSATIHLFSLEIYKIMVLMSIVPLAANTVAFATELNTYPEKASMAVFISTIVALFYIPLVVGLFLS